MRLLGGGVAYGNREKAEGGLGVGISEALLRHILNLDSEASVNLGPEGPTHNCLSPLQ